MSCGVVQTTKHFEVQFSLKYLKLSESGKSMGNREVPQKIARDISKDIDAQNFSYSSQWVPYMLYVFAVVKHVYTSSNPTVL